MLSFNEMFKYTKERVSEKRFNHILRVVEIAKKLSRVYDVDEEKAIIAALLHDVAKEMKDIDLLQFLKSRGYTPDKVERRMPKILHGRVGAFMAKEEMGVEDKLILDAITYHSICREEMTLLDKVIYIADAIEPGRKFENMEQLSNLAFSGNIDLAFLECINLSIEHVINKKEVIHLDTIRARNKLL